MVAGAQALSPVRDLASTRILRLAVGITLAHFVSQAFGWSAGFLTPVLASVLLTLPLPAPTLRGGLSFVLVLAGSLLIGLLMLPMLHTQPIAGVLLVILALFGSFYYGASGGSAALAMFLLVGVSVVPVVGSESIDGILALSQGLTLSAIAAVVFVWLAFAIFPDPPDLQHQKRPPAPAPPPEVAARIAIRSTVIVAPVLLWLLFTSETSAYAVVLIKVASMGQQAEAEGTRAAGRDLLASTLIGGIAAILIWNVLQIWPSLVIYSLLFLLCCLLMGPKIFSGQGLAPRASMWSYALLTMVVIIAPAVADSAGGDSAGARFDSRIAMFVVATLYAVVVVYVFDSLWPARVRPAQHPRDP
jgi:hypothetical protein